MPPGGPFVHARGAAGGRGGGRPPHAGAMRVRNGGPAGGALSSSQSGGLAAERPGRPRPGNPARTPGADRSPGRRTWNTAPSTAHAGPRPDPPSPGAAPSPGHVPPREHRQAARPPGRHPVSHRATWPRPRPPGPAPGRRIPGPPGPAPLFSLLCKFAAAAEPGHAEQARSRHPCARPKQGRPLPRRIEHAPTPARVRKNQFSPVAGRIAHAQAPRTPGPPGPWPRCRPGRSANAPPRPRRPASATPRTGASAAPRNEPGRGPANPRAPREQPVRPRASHATPGGQPRPPKANPRQHPEPRDKLRAPAHKAGDELRQTPPANKPRAPETRPPTPGQAPRPGSKAAHPRQALRPREQGRPSPGQHRAPGDRIFA
jgi:hypothetical protein